MCRQLGTGTFSHLDFYAPEVKIFFFQNFFQKYFFSKKSFLFQKVFFSKKKLFQKKSFCLKLLFFFSKKRLFLMFLKFF